jgi:hypothetical protein
MSVGAAPSTFGGSTKAKESIVMAEPNQPDDPSLEEGAHLDKIVSDLDTAGRELPVEAIRQARRYRNEMVPKLIGVLQQASAEALSGKKSEGQAPFFAFFLLAEFQAKEALPAILEAVSLPGELPFDLFGDAVTSVLARVLASLAGDRLELFDQLIGDRGLNEYVRWEGAHAYLLLVRDGRLARVEVVQRLQQHLREAIQQDDYTIAGPLVSELTRLASKEAYDDIAEAYRRDLVDTLLVTLKDVEENIAEGEAGFVRWQARCEPTGIADTIAELETWAAFRKTSPSSPLPPAPIPPRLPRIAPRSGPPPEPKPPVRRVGRNEPCPCGSGKKFKKCCGLRGA